MASILHVEDEPQNRALLRAILTRCDRPILRSAVIHEAPDLSSARRMLATTDIDVVVLDVRLPDGNGLDLARELRARDADHRPRVLVMSASVLPSEQAAARSSGADEFLSKPYRPADLVALLVGWLDGGARAAARC